MYIYLQTTKRYELLNYSEHGTVVDNILYSCNYSMHPSDVDFLDNSWDGQSKMKDHDAVGIIKRIASKNRPATVNTAEKQCICKCANRKGRRKNSNCIEQGWEGSAMIDHGTIVMFGCLTFVFSVVSEYTDR